MAVAQEAVAEVKKWVVMRSFSRSYAFDPTMPKSGEIFGRMGTLDTLHLFARQCAQNCFLSVDIKKYDEDFRKFFATLVNIFKDRLPDTMVTERATLKKILAETGFLSQSSKELNAPKDELVVVIEKQKTLFLRCGEDHFSITDDSVVQLTKRMVGGIAGFGQVAGHIGTDMQSLLKILFGVAAEDGGKKFLADVKSIVALCPPQFRGVLAEQLGINGQMETALKKIMQRNLQELYLLGELSENAQKAITTLCGTLGLEMPMGTFINLIFV